MNNTITNHQAKSGSPIKWWLSFLLAALALYGGYSGLRIYRRMQEVRQAESPSSANAEGSVVGQRVAPFQLIDAQGRPFDSGELQGQPWVASFFFTSCAGACLRMNNTIARLQTEMPDADVRYVSITVDPENDTPEALEKYARHYTADPARWRFLTGPPDDIKHIANEVFRVAYGREAHSDRLIVVDREGKIQGTYRATEDAQMVLLKRKLEELAAFKTEPSNSH